MPDGFVPIPAFEATTAPDGARCMGLSVRNRWEQHQPGAMPYVEVTDGKGHSLYVARGRKWAAAGEGPADERMSLVATLCGDLNADRVPELLLTERTPGAHCCFTHYAVSMTRPATTLLMWEQGDAGTEVMPVKAKPGKTYQLISGVVTWPRFSETDAVAYSYSGAPILPIVFQLEGTEYRARTFRYAAFIAQQRERARRRCGTNPYCSATSLADWGTALLVGDWEQQRKHLDFDADMLAALNRNANAYRRDLQRLLGR